MLNVTAQELETMLATIDRALVLHETWREQLNRTIICKLPPQEADMADDAHTKCAFGQWYYSASNAKLRKVSSFQKIEDLHRAMHGKARELCVMLKGRWGIGHKDYDAFVASITGFRTELVGLRQKVAETLQKVDPLTGAYCSKYLLPELQKDQAQKKATGKPYSLLLLRFDLMDYNRQEGRDKGDEILREAIQGVRDILAAEDKLFRYAGAEFVICLPGRDHDAANAIRERMIEAVGYAFTKVNVNLEATLDIEYGIVELDPDVYIEEVIKQAKLATYKLKI